MKMAWSKRNMSGTCLGRYLEELGRYEMITRPIHFPHDKPLPLALVKKIVRARPAENAEEAEKRRQKR